jgi:SAM-dependent methyltransferase
MSTTQIDATEFRARQRTDWDSASTGWKAWHELIDAATHRVSERMIELAGIKTRDRVLDVAAGYGEPSLTAARVVGPEGSVVATDISSGMLAFGRERAAAAGLDNVEFIESEAASLDYPAGTFDAALSRWGLIFEPDGEGTAGRIRGFLKEGGRLAISSWGSPEQVPMLGVPMGTVMERLDVPPPPPGTPGPLSRPTREAITALLEGGGFSDIQVEEVNLEFEWDSAEDFTRFVREIAPPVSNLLAPHPPEVQEETWGAVTEAARAHTSEDGKVRMSNLAFVAAGQS